MQPRNPCQNAHHNAVKWSETTMWGAFCGAKIRTSGLLCSCPDCNYPMLLLNAISGTSLPCFYPTKLCMFKCWKCFTYKYVIFLLTHRGGNRGDNYWHRRCGSSRSKKTDGIAHDTGGRLEDGDWHSLHLIGLSKGTKVIPAICKTSWQK